MISKLQKLQAKLSFIDLEDLYTLTIYSSDLTIVKYLQKFITQYSEFYNVSEIFKGNVSKKQSFVSVLIQKLYESIGWIKSWYLPGPSPQSSPSTIFDVPISDMRRIHELHGKELLLKRKVIFNICETLRICFREMIDFLSLLQHCQLFYSLCFVVSQRYLLFMDFHKLILSAYRVLINSLNNAPDRISIFLLQHEQIHLSPFSSLADLNPIERLTELIYNRTTSARELLVKRVFSSSASLLSPRNFDSEDRIVKDPSPSKSSVKTEGREWKTEEEVLHKAQGKASSLQIEEHFEAEVIRAEGKESERKQMDPDDISFLKDDDSNGLEHLLEDLDESAISGGSCDLQILNYLVKIIYMMACQSEDARNNLRRNGRLLKALLYRLSRCLIDKNHFIQVVQLSRSTEINSLQALTSELPHHSYPAPFSQTVSSENSAAASSSSTVQMIDFPYCNENYTLFSTICKLLYLFDVYSLLEQTQTTSPRGARIESPLSADAIQIITIDPEFVDYFVSDLQLNYHKKRDEIESMDDIHIMVRLKSSSSLNQANNHSLRSVASSESNSYRLHASPMTQSEKYSQLPLYSLPAIDLLNFIVMVVLTIGPYNWSLYITANHQENISSAMFYTGNLIHCEEHILQLLMLSSDQNIQTIIQSSTASTMTRKPLLSSSSSLISASEMANQIVAHRLLFLSNSLIRILIILLQRVKTNNLDLQEKSALLCPVVIAIMKLIQADDRSFHIVKRLVFPSPYAMTSLSSASTSANMVDTPLPSATSSRGGIFASSSASTKQSSLISSVGSAGSKDQRNNMHPIDCPENSLRHALIHLMTSLDTNLKRCISECLYVLCEENKDEFVYRTGFGNSIALLQSKGLF